MTGMSGRNPQKLEALVSKAVEKYPSGNKALVNVIRSEAVRDKSYQTVNKKAIAKSIARNAKKAAKRPSEGKQLTGKSGSRGSRIEALVNKAVERFPSGNKAVVNVIRSEAIRDKSYQLNNKKAIAKSIARNAKKKAKR